MQGRIAFVGLTNSTRDRQRENLWLIRSADGNTNSFTFSAIHAAPVDSDRSELSMKNRSNRKKPHGPLKGFKRFLIFVFFSISLFIVLLELAMRLCGFVIMLPNRLALMADRGSDGDFRILAVGESTTFGLHVGTDSAYPARLEYLLRERFPGTAFTVMNTGVPSQTSTSILRNIHFQLAKYRPDLVISLVGANDMNEALNDLNTRVLFGSIYVPEWIAGLRIYKLLSVTKDYFLHRPIIEKDGAWTFCDETQKHPGGGWIHNDRYERQLLLNYRDIVDIVRQHGAELAILSYVHRSDRLHALFGKVTGEKNAPYLDLYIPPEERTLDLFTGDYWHPSAAGHNYMARKILHGLLTNRLIPSSGGNQP